MDKKPKLIVILGPTATGKTGLALQLAREFNGEVVSADSRQVYKHMKIGTDVPDGQWQDGVYQVAGIPHHLLDCIEPDQEFTLADFKKEALQKIEAITKRGKVPFLVGGTGLYIAAIVDNLDLTGAKPDKKLRAELSSKNLDELVSLLKEKDPASAAVIDLHNPRRVIRALEVVLTTGQSFVQQKTKSPALFSVLQIGLSRPRAEIYRRINERVDQQIERGLVKEIKELLRNGFTWDLPGMSGLGYRQFKDYLRDEGSQDEAIENLKRDTRHYAKRQLTWFKRDQRINWISADDHESAVGLVKQFLEQV